MKHWIFILLPCIPAFGQNINVTNVPLAVGYTSGDTALAVTNGHLARVPLSMIVTTNLPGPSVNLSPGTNLVSSTNNGQVAYSLTAVPAADGSLITNVYGRSYGPSLLSIPKPWYSASDFNPIHITGAGTAAANGDYYKSSSNLVAGLPYAVFTNSTGSSYRLVLNDTNFVPSTFFSNLWTIESTINVNYAYDMAGPAVPFGTWEVSGIGGTPGVAPAPMVGSGLPDLISLSAAAAGGTLTLSPGVYELGGYIWYPTNLTVIAYGASISSLNGVEGIHPFGSFQMYGGSYSNGAFIGTGAGSLCVRMDHSTNYVSFFGSKLFGATDTIGGFINSDNFTLSLNGCELGDNWDVATFAKVSSLSNVTFTAVGTKFYSVTNGISSASVLITPGANQTRISGCYLEQGLGFSTGAGLAALTANTTNELNGCVIITRNGLPKVQQTSGVLIVDGSPYDPSEVSGTVIFKGTSWYSATNSMTAQTITIGRSVYTNLAGNVTFTGLTSSPAGNYEGTGTATLLSNGSDRTIVTPVSWHCSDFVSTRTLTNGNQMVLTAKVIPGISTNVAISQFK